ncbi:MULTISPECIES: FHA domain-containing protein [unclassified Crossiella]|uniref:FHA domain-containing protein n=1 Tax=unclassified Crossiella TaxID=2620835 RepID=UPI001FFF77CF|nr:MULTISPECIES: FHA domain-containing protein [unclassified Crossiella]MCK2242975.1 FHA domain-containing protein [Crossiella sp. S99.2]MCK2256852.1 FHA domain-containing protein [Crossiella sp. S99.1]
MSGTRLRVRSPQRWVGRLHCTLDLALGLWSVTDNDSVNGTLLRRDGGTRRLLGRRQLRHGDRLLILGEMTPEGEPSYWELTFIDPHVTGPAPLSGPTAGPYLRYDWARPRILETVTRIGYRLRVSPDRGAD